ncbi:MAG: DoxX family protein [Alistipes sp.]
MEKRMRNWIEQYQHMDWAVLYVRLFAGGMMLLHNIGKIQTYNEIIGSYPSLLYVNSATLFVLIAVVEVSLSVLIMIGLWVRMSALIMAIGFGVMFLWPAFGAGDLQFVWLGIYIFLIISGGGIYSFDGISNPSRGAKQTNRTIL